MVASRALQVLDRGSRAILAVLLTFGLLLAHPPSLAADGITVTKSDISYNFAQQATFSVEATSSATITRVDLFFRAIGDVETENEPIPIEQPRSTVDLEYVLDLRRSPLPPFADITYWWRIEDEAGNEVTTEPKQFNYTDNRFDWETIQADGINVHWVQGDPAFGQAALDIAQASVREINAALRAPLTDPINLYIYDTPHNLAAAMMLAGRDWAGGQAHPDLGVVVVSIPFEQGYTARMKRYIPHEITHLLVYRVVTSTGYKYVPEWLDEGLATFNERLPTPEYTLALEEARAAGDLIPLRELCDPFSPDRKAAVLSYAQSASVVAFIHERYGSKGIRALLAAYADGVGCTGGVREALGISFDELETEWRRYLEPQAPWRVWMERIGVWIGLWLLTLLVALPMIGGLRRRRVTGNSFSL